jgi:hypothetical protein
MKLLQKIFLLTFLLQLVSACMDDQSIGKTIIIPDSSTNCPPEYKHMDNNASLARDGSGNLWLIVPHGGVLYSTPWSVFKGTNMDNLVKQYESDPSNTMFPRPYNDDTYWSGGLWIDSDGKWYCPTHIEFNYEKYGKFGHAFLSLQRRLCLTTSIDNGKTWVYEGDILTSDNSYNPSDWEGKQIFDQGPGDAQLYYDDEYFYLFFMDAWVVKEKWVRYCAVRAARCPKADKMSPGKWQKWYNGKWSEPGIGGHCTDVLNYGGTETASVFYSTYLKKYCALVSGGNSGKDFSVNPDLFFSTCSDLNKQDWSTPVKVASAGKNGFYNWPADKITSSRIRIDGNSFRYYTCGDKLARWYDVKFAGLETKSAAEKLTPVYTPVSVKDFTPGWDSTYMEKGK